MAFSKSALVAVIAASVAVLSAEAFAPVQTQSFVRNTVVTPKYAPLPVSLSSVGDVVGEDEDDVNEPAPEDFIVSAGDLDDEPADVLDDDETDGPFEHQERLKELRTAYRRHETDSGSPEFQVAGMTERITYLTKHLKLHPKDFSTRRGLVALVNKRRRLMNYLFREDIDRYQALVKSLGIRHKAPGRVQSREDKYGRFPQQKDKRSGKKK
uniref:30S ribosomal protein S15 n=1 Tax=Odontella aurita TaxID=265563 RepID=A0A7S4N0D3_9STRA|mmetsp:Transcript_42669/g.129607  ORF Transcript_42669/g.129607 Transcript_42669/m.129607 type:complete len:211 (+) Transcript_42669:115-747(+)